MLLPALIALVVWTPGAARARGEDPDYLIRGAGPVGLASALELIHAGVPPEEVRVLEARNTQGSGNLWGSRDRSVVLDEATVEQLTRLGVHVPGSAYREAVFFVADQPMVLKNTEGLQKFFFEPVFGRKFSRIVRIGDLEHALADRATALGVLVDFGVRSKVEYGADEKAGVRIDGRAEPFQPRMLLATDGRNSDTRAAIGVEFSRASLGSNPLYIGSDFDHSSEAQGGRAMVFLDEKLGVLGYGFTHSKGGSIGVMIDPSSTEEHRLRKLREIAKKMGASPESLKGVYEYSGELAQSDSIHEGNVFIIGDAARTTDPASGNGLNTGLRDARDLGQWIRDERRGIEGGMEKFLRNVTENTRYTFRGSVQFQRLPAWAKERLGAFSPLLRYSDGGALNAASVHAPKVVSKTAGKVLRWVGAQTGMPMADHDPTQSLLIHGRLAETSCDRSFLSRTLDGLLRSAR